MRGETQKEILILKQKKRNNYFKHIFDKESRAFLKKCDKHINLWYDIS